LEHNTNHTQCTRYTFILYYLSWVLIPIANDTRYVRKETKMLQDVGILEWLKVGMQVMDDSSEYNPI